MTTRSRHIVLGEVTRALSKGASPDQVVRVALTAIRDAIDADIVSWAYLEGSRLRFVILEGDGFSTTAFERRTGGLTEAVFDGGEPLLIGDLMEAGLPLRRLVGEESAHARSYVGVPARAGRRLMGVLSVQAYRPHVFGHGETELIAQVGRQLADAIVSSRRVARMRRRLDEMDRSQRERTDFLVGVAHDMRSPLAGIIGFARILEELDSVTGDPMALEAVRFIAAESQRLADLVAELVDLGRVDLGEATLEREPLDLRRAAEHAVESVRGRFPGHRFVVRAPQPVPVEADLLRLDRVIVNLVENAAVHGPQGGLVTIDVAREGEEAVLAVSDRGTGVSPEERDRVFERFVRLDGSSAGSGIGLYLVKGLVEAHGGSVSVDDAPGGGARFTVRLGSPSRTHPVA